MIPYDFIYYAVYDNFLCNLNTRSTFPVITEQFNKLDVGFDHKKLTKSELEKNCVVFYDQEPIDLPIFKTRLKLVLLNMQATNKILITSEYSKEQELIATDMNSYHVHYFYHALLCHEWYRSYWYKNIEVHTKFDRVYNTYNNLILDKRLYRANLIVELHNRNLIEDGYVAYNNKYSARIGASTETYKLLPVVHKSNILENLDVLTNQLIIDTATPNGALSAEIDIDEMQRAFVNLVTETIFYENKIHLTEKVFKPIVAKMPFLLFAGAGNLAYLRSYGFKTFGDFWDESYDSITNNVDRFNAIMDVLTHLCSLPHSKLAEMKIAMSDILEYNFNHFYKTLRPIVVDEFTTNLGNALVHNNINFDPAELQRLNKILTY